MYIIDFERINYLTSHPSYKPDEGYLPFHVYNTTRTLIKQYMETYQNYNNDSTTMSRFRSTSHRSITIEQYNEAVEILRFNKILLDKSDIREQKLNEVLDDK
jgi:hypothetical protein